MLSTILVPLDGSELAERTLPCAEGLARATGARLVLARCVDVFTPPSMDLTEREAVAIAEAELYLNVITEQLKQADLRVKAVVACGAAVNEILEEVRRRAANLIVMAIHDRSGPKRWLYGSVAEEVLRRSNVPIVVVPTAAACARSGERPRRILVALDGSAFSESVLDPVSALAAQVGAELVLVRIVCWPPVVADRREAPPELLDAGALLASANEYLRLCAQRLATRIGAPRCRVELGWPHDLLPQVAEEEHADLIAMATHGRSGMARVVLGSVASGAL